MSSRWRRSCRRGEGTGEKGEVPRGSAWEVEGWRRAAAQGDGARGSGLGPPVSHPDDDTNTGIARRAGVPSLGNFGSIALPVQLPSVPKSPTVATAGSASEESARRGLEARSSERAHTARLPQRGVDPEVIVSLRLPAAADRRQPALYSVFGTRRPGTSRRSAMTTMAFGDSGQAYSHRPQPVQAPEPTRGRPPICMIARSG